MKKYLSIIFILVILSFFIINNALAINLGDLNPLGLDPRSETMQVLIGNVIKSLLTVVGSVALLFVVYGGMILLTSHGNQEPVTKGKKILIWAIIGFALVIGSYMTVDFVIKGITGEGGTPGGTTTGDVCRPDLPTERQGLCIAQNESCNTNEFTTQAQGEQCSDPKPKCCLPTCEALGGECAEECAAGDEIPDPHNCIIKPKCCK